MTDLKKEYNLLAKKHKLPKYDDIDNEFELLGISPVEEIKFPLRFVRRRMDAKIAWYCGLLQGILQPNPGSFISLNESNFFKDTDRKKFSTLLKLLMKIERQSLHLDTMMSEKGDAEFISENFKAYLDLKKELSVITLALKEGWNKEAAKIDNNRTNYVG